MGRSAVRLILVLLLSSSPILAAHAGSSWENAVALFNRQNYREALVQFRAAYQQQSQPAACCYYQGLCYQRLGDLTKAIEMYGFARSQFAGSDAARLSDTAMALLQTNKPSEPQTAITVPFRQLSNGLLLVSPSINGTTVPMIFDTGAAFCFISRGELDRLRLHLDDRKSPLLACGIGGAVRTRKAAVNIRLGAFSRQVNLYFGDSPTTGKGADLALLGQTFFGSSIYRIDYTTGYITFFPSHTVLPKEHCVPFRQEGNRIVVLAKINGRECECILDTGASNLAFSDKQLSALSISRPTSARSGRSSGVGVARNSFFFAVESVELGSCQRHHVASSVAIDSSSDRPLLGASFLRGTRLTVDPFHKLISIENEL